MASIGMKGDFFFDCDSAVFLVRNKKIPIKLTARLVEAIILCEIGSVLVVSA